MQTSTPNLPTKPRPVNPILGLHLCAVEIEDLKTGEIRRTVNPVPRARAQAVAREKKSKRTSAHVIYLGWENEIKSPVLCSGFTLPDPKEAA